MKNLTTSAKFSKFLGRFFTYLFLITLSVIIIYPLAITVTSAFQPGNTTAFALRLDTQWTLENFRRLFEETRYLQWYKNTLIVAITTMVAQVFIVTIAGYAYSRYNFIGRKQSLLAFLVIQMVPTMAALTASVEY